jgi:uncharacterized protein with ParB-like and HNH nuclease domain
MTGNTKPIFQLFLETSRFLIPIYQRPYSWGEVQCARLFSDIEACANGNRHFHFFGSIVSVATGNGLIIIDGQQRITTISLLLLAIRHVIEKCARPCSFKGDTVAWMMGECILERLYPLNPNRYKLTPIDSDLQTYRKIVADEPDIPDGNLDRNFRFFINALINSNCSLDQILAGIEKLSIIAINMEQSENPQLVFESINSTGLNLDEGDKIRNFVLMDLVPEDQEWCFKDYWARIENATKRGPHDDGIGLFIRDFLTMKTGDVPKIKDTYEEFKRHCSDLSDWTENRRSVLAELLQAAEQYEHLLKPATIQDAGVSWRMFNINRQEVLPAYPFLLHVFLLHNKGKLSTEDLNSILGIVDSYVFRRLICGLPTNSLNKVFKDLAKSIEAIAIDASYSEKMAFALSMKSGNSRIPTDTEFRQGMIERPVYDMHIKNRAYLFARLEHGVSKDAPTTRCSDAVWQMIMDKAYTIEHVMPQTLTREWRAELGPEKAEDTHSKWLHRLANLTISAYNAEMSNKSFGEKSGRSFGTLKSQVISYTEAAHHIWLTGFIAAQEHWSEREMQTRAEILADRALSIWPMPTFTFTPPSNLEFEYSILSHDSRFFTGSKPISFALLGDVTKISTWRELAVRACQRMNAEDPVRIRKIATDANGQGLEGHLLLFEANHSTKIADGLFLQKLGSAWEHCQFIKKLLKSNPAFGDVLVRFSEDLDEKNSEDEDDSSPSTPAYTLGAFHEWIDKPIQRLDYAKFKTAMKEAFQSGGEGVCGVVVFQEGSWDQNYSEDARSYLVSSDNLAFDDNPETDELTGWALDGTDNGAWLDEYMSGNNDNPPIEVDYCYIPTHNGVYIHPDDPIVKELFTREDA